MAFVVEDGSEVAGANAYAEVAFVDAYFNDRMVTSWASINSAKKQANIIAATDYIDSRWGQYFKGCRLTETQALEFPRDAFVDSNGDGVIPETLKKAVAEYALRADTAPLAPDVEQDASGYQVSRKIEKVGPIEERTDFAFLGPGATRQLLKPYPAADMLMRSLLKNTQGRVIRN